MRVSTNQLHLCQMHQTQSHRRSAKDLKKKKGFMSSVNGVSHLSRRAKRRLYCKLQLWMWRKRREKCSFWILRAKKRACSIRSGFNPCLILKKSRIKRRSQTCHTLNVENSQVKTSALAAKLECDTGGTGGTISQTAAVPSQPAEASVQLGGFTSPLKRCHPVQLLQSADSHEHEGDTHFKVLRTMTAQRFDPSEQPTASCLCQDQTADSDADEGICCKNSTSSQNDVGVKALTKDIHEYLDRFYRIYGSFIPLHKSDVLGHLNRKFNTDFSDRKNAIFTEVTRYQTTISEKPVPSFRVVYKKHILTLEDLLTLADQNWLNDQVMNMYGDLIMESSDHTVHFLNSFFHRQLMTKGYDGVKRWTKQVDLFSKSLLLVPIHLEVHWCLVIADIVKKKICLYDSQGNALQKVARNILKYLMTEAKEKQHTAFENGWTVSFDEKIPQQTNENDCGVFVLEYSRCLALTRPLQFSQKDIPKIRKRIYKELCDCKLHELD
ncbi:sentrin-specific protease 5-like isoform X2 [Parambassis ranga]|uniref:Sentrin-specific protease 5-like isoform X2 n=1 Tax=Parambassis ranga TaxID=210632 RepID=A0A6P7K2R8_9TELE|nr:sentrin-specific protease 5-like isoform X2 [Parambassis ranga]